MNEVRRLVWVVGLAVRRPRVAWHGAREFRLGSTAHYDYPQIESYDAGRELAHMLTLRRWDEE